ncbi:RNA polymerase sigma factor [Idiomarina xiamenensis]|uniref:RNA polymerase sigma factor n=1 Tax=Idiomarina xiamenensis 10-D-4 TaxID=740709 RepID=K2KAW2_9GAMM|nr:sigma-70 family RNA polymerase sigma factor [Idiomarina xiamenensis]EKE83657.1 RNA polymerase sigma factor [Idiomarina xiamenensis 10-D-4]
MTNAAEFTTVAATQSDADAALVQRAQVGDMDAFEALYQRHLRRVYGLVLRLSVDRHQAEDITQEVFVQVWRKLASFRGESRFSTWLHTLATRVTISALRKHKRWYQRWFSDDDEVPQQVAESSADLVLLDRLIMRLPERARWVFVLHQLEGLRHEDIANTLGIAVGSSKAQLHRARQLLEEWVGNETI